ncbi:EAL domain-containing protein [Geminocystis herdmanii]|uniref:EAL domain-containing protein n=1 Tax=Geminocystis herdmanii TaxID=669359 RepID=UPI00178C6B7F|nr:EAL domain-containing protein [Geminocystis herdmanii]
MNRSRVVNFIKYLGLLSTIVLLIFTHGQTQEMIGKTKSPTLVTVGIYQNNPKIFIDDNEKPAGFWVEIIDGIAQAENWSITYIPCQWKECLRKVERGDIDLMVDVAYSDKRNQLFDFNNEVVLASWSQVYARRDLNLNSILDLDGKKVGILKSSIQKEVLQEQIKAFGITPELIEVDDFNDIFVLIETGEIDAGIVNNFFGKKFDNGYNIVRTNILINPARLHFIVKTGDPLSLLPRIDRQLQLLIKDSNSIYYQAQKKWLEPNVKFGWKQIKDIIINSFIYLPFFVLIFLSLWNYLLKKEINYRKKIEFNLEESKQRYASLTSVVPVGIFRTNIGHKCIYINDYCCELMGLSPEKVIGEGWLNGIYSEDRDMVLQYWLNCIEENQQFKLEYRFQRPDGEIIWVYGQCIAEYDAQGKLKGYVGTITNISDRIKIEQQLKHNALHDKLTGLPNRHLLIERLELALKKQKRYLDYNFSLLFLDLDNFKIVNDSLGHLVGDELLIEVAKILKFFIRDTDVASRLGGDEFVILLEDIEGIAEGVKIAQRILEGLQSPLILSNQEVFVSTSIGIICGGERHHSALDLLRDGDIAMYRAKKNGKGKYAIFDPVMDSQAMERLQIENDLRIAIDKNQFIIYYQPIVNLETNSIEEFEALIRWQHPEKGLLSPIKFIDIAEETGLIIPIGTWMLENACQQLLTWQKQFNHSLKVNVNLSVRQLQESLLSLLDRLLVSYPLQPNTLGLEITESMLIQNIDITINLLNQIKMKGISISIDDFGTGYSSFSYLHQLPVDALKIDRSFVNVLDLDNRHRVIAESIISLSQSIGIKTVAEGIENEKQKQWLQNKGCRLGQGYLFSPPVTAIEATVFLQKQIYVESAE